MDDDIHSTILDVHAFQVDRSKTPFLTLQLKLDKIIFNLKLGLICVLTLRSFITNPPPEVRTFRDIHILDQSAIFRSGKLDLLPALKD